MGAGWLKVKSKEAVPVFVAIQLSEIARFALFAALLPDFRIMEGD
jgi:hypothetical protein